MNLIALHSFDFTDGSRPETELMQATDGNVYGTTVSGGTSSACAAYSSGCGTVFRLSVGLGPFVETQVRSGKVGSPVIILGTNLTSASSVSFNGTTATFTVLSPSAIRATVPPGASTGKIQVRGTANGTLSSSVAFRVVPQIKSFTPTSGPVGTTVQIIGISLGQTTMVTFGGVKAPFAVESYTHVTATVPLSGN
jgi:uncharacterized repeat protein (TIGR03803 family)